jgi:hypothetical protein
LHKIKGNVIHINFIEELFWIKICGPKAGVIKLMGVLKKHFIVWIFVGALGLMGCEEPEKQMESAFLIKTTSMIITSSDFSEELDLKRASYPYDIDKNSAEYNEMVMDLIQMLSEEILLLSVAADKGVTVMDHEVQSAEDEFKKDYPEDSFEQILLKNAISYSFWKKRFKKNMIMDKLIDKELREKIEITSQDIVKFYKKYRIDDSQKKGKNAPNSKKIEDGKELVSRLRQQKAQDHYDEWVQQLWKDYPVQINKEKLKTFLIDTKTRKGSENEK